MHRVDAVRLKVPCPSCHVPQSLVAAFGRPGADAAAEAILSECTRCWSARARALNDARASLRGAGDLAGTGRLMTWRGELLSGGHEHDGLEGALLSALLRRDLAPTFRARLSLPAPAPAEIAETGPRRR